MIPLSTNLDDTDFEALFTAARSRLPALAPEWTDYNEHDPGIMLVELLAWLADMQIYSLARNRHDERLAMARLLGAPPRGAVPAGGIVYPADELAAARPIDPGTALLPGTGTVQPVETTVAVTLLPYAIHRIAAIGSDGRATDLTAINTRARAGFPPFGEANDGVLRILLGPVKGARAVAGDVLLSLGFEVEGADPSRAAMQGEAITVADDRGRPVAIAADTTGGLQRSGALVLRLTAAALDAPILVRPARHYVLSPRVTRIAINAVPVEQRATVTLDIRTGNGRPGQVIEMDPSTLFPSDEHGDGPAWCLVEPPMVESITDTGPVRWTRGLLDTAGPDDRRFACEERPAGDLVRIRFGNGVNGRRPALEERLAVTLRLSCGAGGIVHQPVDWVMDGARTLWRNREPIDGGADAETVDDALAHVRRTLDRDRVLATSQQIADAALALDPALGIVRAVVEEGWERGRRAPAIPATRTLIVAHKQAGHETPDWIAHVAGALRPRISIGERLLVVPPVLRPFSLDVSAGLAPGHDGKSVVARIGREIADRFSLADARWPLGRDIDPAALAGWVRRIEGVAAPVRVRLMVDGVPVPRLSVGRGELPWLGAPPAIVVGGAA